MCYHNFVCHNGCGHLGSSNTNPYTFCDAARARLAATGFTSPPKQGTLRRISTTFKRTSTISRSADQFNYNAHGSSLNAAQCPILEERQIANSDMDVCADCKRSVEDMRFLVARYDRSGSVKGCTAFDRFLKDR